MWSGINDSQEERGEERGERREERREERGERREERGERREERGEERRKREEGRKDNVYSFCLTNIIKVTNDVHHLVNTRSYSFYVYKTKLSLFYVCSCEV